MLCDVCEKKEAVVHYTEVVNGQMKKMDLCESCAVDKGIGKNISLTMGDLLTGLSDTENNPEQQQGNACSKCKMTFVDFKKTGRLGCSHCYETFSNSLLPLLETIHRSAHHLGKIPTSNKKAAGFLDRIKKLNEELQSAIAREEFEKAAQIRDEILQLEKKEKGPRRRNPKRGSA